MEMSGSIYDLGLGEKTEAEVQILVSFHSKVPGFLFVFHKTTVLGPSLP